MTASEGFRSGFDILAFLRLDTTTIPVGWQFGYDSGGDG
jgi:hypothetical protein